jgi:hypothetical protein
MTWLRPIRLPFALSQRDLSRSRPVLPGGRPALRFLHSRFCYSLRRRRASLVFGPTDPHAGEEFSSRSAPKGCLASRRRRRASARTRSRVAVQLDREVGRPFGDAGWNSGALELRSGCSSCLMHDPRHREFRWRAASMRACFPGPVPRLRPRTRTQEACVKKVVDALGLEPRTFVRRNDPVARYPACQQPAEFESELHPTMQLVPFWTLEESNPSGRNARCSAY